MPAPTPNWPAHLPECHFLWLETTSPGCPPSPGSGGAPLATAHTPSPITRSVGLPPPKPTSCLPGAPGAPVGPTPHRPQLSGAGKVFPRHVRQSLPSLRLADDPPHPLHHSPPKPPPHQEPQLLAALVKRTLNRTVTLTTNKSNVKVNIKLVRLNSRAPRRLAPDPRGGRCGHRGFRPSLAGRARAGPGDRRPHRPAQRLRRPGRGAHAVGGPDLTDARHLLHDRLQHRPGRPGRPADLPGRVHRLPDHRDPDDQAGPLPAVGGRLLHLRGAGHRPALGLHHRLAVRDHGDDRPGRAGRVHRRGAARRAVLQVRLRRCPGGPTPWSSWPSAWPAPTAAS